MVLVDKLPIFKQTYELVSLLLDYVASFPKVYRFTLGDKITNTSLALFEYILLANRCGKDKQKRSQYLSSFLIKFELLKVLIRICNEKRIFSLKQASHLAMLVTSIGKQATGWKNA